MSHSDWLHANRWSKGVVHTSPTCLAVARAEDRLAWQLPLEQLAEQLPLVQRYPSHIVRVLQPAHEMLRAASVIRSAEVRTDGGQWLASYTL